MSSTGAPAVELPAVPPNAGSRDSDHATTETPVAWANTPIGNLGLTTRSQNCLERARVRTVADLLTWTADDLRSLTNFGQTSLRDVEAALARLGLRLGDPPDTLQAAYADIQLARTVDLLRHVAAEAVAATPGLTIGELFAAITDDSTSGLTDTSADELRHTPAAILAGDLLVTYRWRDTILAAYDKLDDRTKLVCDDLAPGTNRPRHTLEEVAIEWQITRERIRQINDAGRDRLGAAPVVIRAADRLAGFLDPVCSETVLLDAGFDPDDHATLLLAAVAVRRGLLPQRSNFEIVETHGTRWVAGGAPIDPATYIGDALDSHPHHCLPRATVETELAARMDGRATADEVAALLDGALADTGRYRVIDGIVADWVGSYLAKMQRVLHIASEPLSKDALAAAVSGPERSVISQLSSPEGRQTIVRTVTGDFALTEWDWVERYTQCIDLMKRIIGEHGGSMSLRRLAREVTAVSEFSPVSVQMYATMRPEFVTASDVVRLRRSDEPVPIKAPQLDDDLFRVLHGPNRGAWSWAHTIDYKRMRAASTNAPVPLVQILGLDYDSDATIEVNDGRSITVRWVANDVRVHTSTGFKALCKSLGAGNGDQVVLAFPGGRSASAELRPAPDPGAGPADQILQRIGGGTAATLLADLAYTVGFDGAIDVDVTVDDLLSRLSERRDGRLIELLLAVHPELAD